MASYDALPGTLNLSLRKADDFSALIDFSIPLTAHTMTATIQSLITGDTVDTFTTTMTDAALGKVTIALSDTQTGALQPATYRWVMTSQQGALTRTYLSGYVEVTR